MIYINHWTNIGYNQAKLSQSNLHKMPIRWYTAKELSKVRYVQAVTKII